MSHSVPSYLGVGEPGSILHTLRGHTSLGQDVAMEGSYPSHAAISPRTDGLEAWAYSLLGSRAYGRTGSLRGGGSAPVLTD